ncbi:Hypothetical protein PHPALM_16839 [Phytophthora palmivora]|uniref:Reverse transcriptase RNase H-like domain-containing protein n=1 Tax=Phytophthora palmivora TaxID=4796 RepID=A0A2P4XNP9_9STRA|nr:Hypothetical protein PHPALM_16839 [Phytophthora palmivora]
MLNAVQLKNFKDPKRRLSDTPLHFQVDNGTERPTAYTSRKMKSAELKYPTQQQELLAIVNASAAFRVYCLDRPGTVETDHKSLEGSFQQKMANRRIARWYDFLAKYQPVSAYLPGTKNGYTKDKVIRETRHAIKKREEPNGTCRVIAKQYKTYFEEKKSTDEIPRIVGPIIVALKHRIIAEVRDSNYGGHTDTNRTYLKLQED